MELFIAIECEAMCHFNMTQERSEASNMSSWTSNVSFKYASRIIWHLWHLGTLTMSDWIVIVNNVTIQTTWTIHVRFTKTHYSDSGKTLDPELKQAQMWDDVKPCVNMTSCHNEIFNLGGTLLLLHNVRLSFYKLTIRPAKHVFNAEFITCI